MKLAAAWPGKFSAVPQKDERDVRHRIDLQEIAVRNRRSRKGVITYVGLWMAGVGMVECEKRIKRKLCLQEEKYVQD